MALGYAMRFGGLALALIAGFPSNLLQPSQAAVIETAVILTSEALPQETSTTSSINPWPTDTTYTWPSEEECIATSTDGSPGNCLLSLTAWHSDPGFMTNYCGRKSFTTTETRTLTVDCGGCDQLKVSVRRGGCPHGIPPPKTITPELGPYYAYRWACASTPEPSLPTIPACLPRE